MAQTIIYDCDPGRDDAIALMLAVGDPRLDLAAVTTVGGNLPLAGATANALDLLAALGAGDIPVYAGAGKPLVADLVTAPAVHGCGGLDGVDHNSALAPCPGHAAAVIARRIMESDPGTITLVATGPLTNLALAVELEPAIAHRVNNVVIMGGGYHTGNCTPVAEFNIHTDPEAAAMVFRADWPVVMLGLDVTHQATVDDRTQAMLTAAGTSAAVCAGKIMSAYRTAYRGQSAMPHPPIHDLCAVAYAADPTLFDSVHAPVAVELTGSLTRAMTVVDFRPTAPVNHRHTVVTGVDNSRLFATLREALGRLP
ncbi:nucleoside hydrolase [Corynebacterium mendelii]|uniref:Nucleoside hydrolase n=1 Tax=Corynebacterium mendelii TaxID=2765362 RepID=A0A939IWW5_9CORY|nr:nucleoside hydrolase [Corynebacterium mendelii]MBN9643042.1 nucleoside hydrolase [Corynebacterium mendelii]